MQSTHRHILGSWSVGLWLFGLTGLAALACTTDDDDPGATTDDASASNDSTSSGSGGSGAGGTTSSSNSASTTSTGSDATTATGTGGDPPSGTVCAAPIALDSSTPGIADFEGYDGGAAVDTWSFALGGDSSTGVFAGPFVYGDEASGFPEEYGMVDGNASTYALSISDTLAEEYGGGMGLWLSECLDASIFEGISVWVRGVAPTGQAKLSLLMEETTWEEATSVGTCAATSEEACVHPSIALDVTETWTEHRISWSEFTEGSANGVAIVPDGTNLWQIQFDIGVEWVPDDAGDYQPTPGPYELLIDDLTFY